MIIMHHLRKSRALFMTAFLEELGVDYELRFYDRNEMRRAPPELREVHPLGKSPVIEDNGMTIAVGSPGAPPADVMLADARAERPGNEGWQFPCV